MQTKKEARMYAYDLILDKKDDITKLSEEDKEILTSHIIDSYPKHTAYEFIGEPYESSDYAYMLARYMRTRSVEDGNNLLDLMVKGAVKIASNEIIEILRTQEEEYNFNSKYDTERGI